MACATARRPPNVTAATGWLGSAGHPQDIAQCRRALGALRIGAAAIPRGFSEYTTANLNRSSQLQLRLS
ncbi:hypothetical protein HaLaN_24962 [Haematococcus lacustris]|uniref:Uncharacterized protein n=1 Tax=Haematococcus lacustris TaxID=44745 RepID=A0A6A0A214_HAELA|nr:hypothetical protein HaLaN_24962 [Haematococcus lacustris]